MTQFAVERQSGHEFIFCDPLLHGQFSLAVELLAQVVVAGPLPLTTTALAEAAGQPLRTVRPILSSLHQSNLLERTDVRLESWTCPLALGALTLADVFRCISSVSMPQPRRRPFAPVAGEAERFGVVPAVELLVMQATMAVNQLVLQQLQEFDLRRLKEVGAAASARTFDASMARDFVAEPA